MSEQIYHPPPAGYENGPPKQKNRVHHLNAVLQAIRIVHRHIITETDPLALIQAVCSSLTDTRGFFNAWAILTDADGNVIGGSEAGSERHIEAVMADIRNRRMPHCFQRLEREGRLVIIENPGMECGNCIMASQYENRGALVTRMTHAGRYYGVLTVSLPLAFARDEEEQELFTDVAADIANALYHMEVEERRRQMEADLRKAHDLLERRVRRRTRKLEELSSRLINAQEEERKRIAGDLHDGIGQCLTAVKFIVESSIDQLKDRVPEADLGQLKALIPLLGESSNELRGFVMNLRPTILDDIGILATLQWFQRQMQDIYPHIRFIDRVDVAEEDIPDIIKTAIYRITQEAVNNCIKHSGAQQVEVQLERDDRRICLRISDDGSGIAPGIRSTHTAGSGYGITGMTERAELTGGELDIQSSPGKGTIITARWWYSCAYEEDS